MSPVHILEALAVVFAGAMLQGMAAFGFGLSVVPLLLSIGLPTPMALAVSGVCTAIQSTSGVHRLRHAVPWRQVLFSTLIRCVSMLIGVWVLFHLTHCPVATIKFYIGVVVLGLVVLQACWQPKPQEHLHPVWNYAAFLSSGFTAGLCAMGGPPLVLWVMAHNWSPDRTRAFLFAAFLCIVPLQLGLLYWTFGKDVLSGVWMGLLFSPAVWFGSLVGLRIGDRLSKRLLRRLAYAVLVLIALSGMWSRLVG